MTKKLAESYKKAYGFWEVTTEGDCEGRSVSRLGIYEGYIDEIALALADRCYYSLCFRPIDPRALDLTPKRKSVEISFDIGSNTWDMDNEGIVAAFKEVLTLQTPPDGKNGLPRFWNSLESGIRSPRSLPSLLWHIWFRPGNIRMRSARTLLAGKASARI